MRWSVSKSYEHCFVRTIDKQPVCRAARSCRESGESFDRSGTVAASFSKLRAPHVSVSLAGCIPTVDSREHRRTPANAARHACACRWAANDRRCVPNSGQTAGGSPAVQTRRRKWLGRCSHAGSHSDGLLFFRREPGVITFFPGLGATDFNPGGFEHLPNRFHRDRLDDLFSNEKVSQLGQRPTSVGFTQKIGRTKCRFDNDTSLFLGELLGPSDSVLGLQRNESFFIERLNDGTHVRFGKIESPGDVRYLRSLVRRKYDLGTTHLDPVGVMPDHALKLSPFGHAEVANIKAHDGSPHITTTSMSIRGNPYIPNEINAQIPLF